MYKSATNGTAKETAHRNRITHREDITMAEQFSKKALTKELATIANEIVALEKDIQQLQKADGRSNQVKRIEQMLAERYAEFKKLHPVDKTQDAELARFVSSKTFSVDNAVNSYSRRVQLEVDFLQHESYSSMRNPKLTPYKDRIRDIVKRHIEELKKIFDEVDNSAERFYKSGVSKANLQKLVEVMSKIWIKGESVTVTVNYQSVAKGALPVRYSQKLSKWKNTVREMPDDPELIDNEKEAAAKKQVQDKLTHAQEEVKKLEQELAKLKTDCATKEQDLETWQADLKKQKNSYNASKSRIQNTASENRQSIQHELDVLQSQLRDLTTEKQSLENALEKTFILAFGKKKELKNQIAVTVGDIQTAEAGIQKKQTNLRENTRIENEQLSGLDANLNELQSKIKALKSAIVSLKKKIESTSATLDKAKDNVLACKKAADNFHADYLLKTYGKQLPDTSALISKKNKEIDALRNRERTIKQEIEQLNKAADEAVQKAKQETARQAKILASKQAAEAEREAFIRAQIEAEVRAEVEAEAKRTRAEEEQYRAAQEAAKDTTPKVALKFSNSAPAGSTMDATFTLNINNAALPEMHRPVPPTQEKPKTIPIVPSSNSSSTSQAPAMSSRPQIADAGLAASVDRAISKLEKYFPEHKVFALDSIDGKLRESLANQAKILGYVTLEDMLNSYGFIMISGDDVRQLRNAVVYAPGNEPAAIKNKVDNMLLLLQEYYPDHVIVRGIQNDHKNLSSTISGLYQWLGYADTRAMLTAYGYDCRYSIAGSGRPTSDHDAVINKLVEKYKSQPKPTSMGDLIIENPEYKGTLKTLSNKSKELFGMTLVSYFQEIGILAKRNTQRQISFDATHLVGESASVAEILEEKYADVDSAIYGTAEEAMRHLEGMTVKVNKKGQVYIFRASKSNASVIIPYGVELLSQGVFSENHKITSVTIKAALTEIPEDAFSYCSMLQSVILPESITKISERAFSNCPNLHTINMPESLQRIDGLAFAGCERLENIEIHNPSIYVDNTAFDGAKYSYTPISDNAATDSTLFSYTTDRRGFATITGFNGQLEQITIPARIDGHPVVAIGKGAFADNVYIVELIMPDTITTVQGDAFKGCISLKKLHLSNQIEKMVSTVLSGCRNLQEVNIPDKMEKIQLALFKECPISKLYIGKSLSQLDGRSFQAGAKYTFQYHDVTYRSVRKVVIDPANPYMKAIDTMVLSADGKRLLACLGGKTAVTVPEGVETIESYAFADLHTLADVTLPESLITIGERAFEGTALRTLTLKPKVKTIGAYAFAKCDKMTGILINDGLEVIGERALYSCPLTSLHLPASLRELGEGNFSFHSGKTRGFSINAHNPYMTTDGVALYTYKDGVKTLQKTLQRMYEEARGPYFYDYSQTNELDYVVEDGTACIAPNAFDGCRHIVSVTLPVGLKTIGEKAFQGCYNLKKIELPESLESIGANAFEHTSISRFTIPACVESIGNGAFGKGTNSVGNPILKNISIHRHNKHYYTSQKCLVHRLPSGDEELVRYFGRDEVLEIPDTVTEICSLAFDNTILREVHIPASVKAIGENAFHDCSELVRIRVGFSKPENGMCHAVVYLPVGMTEGGYYNSRQREAFMDCIRIVRGGNIFDFVKYDSLFESIQDAKEKILIATDRLKSAIQLAPVYRDKYLKFLQRNAEKAVQIVVQYDDLAGLNTLAELKVFTGKNIDVIIELANQAKKPEILSFLMNFKNANLGVTETNYDL